ncbi:hypothetical protein ACS2QP_27820, partial [Bacillus cereus group sp. Bce019]|uniref:hypothetical protein n=1 Tax=Bacillus cereus group sp. Bce019 TaxID=3445247 RepID=UPI003F1E9893
RAEKDVRDTSTANDKKGDGGTGFLAQDPLLLEENTGNRTIERPSYVASLGDSSEEFTYTVTYKMFNAPLEMEKNVMFVDTLDYRLQYINA